MTDIVEELRTASFESKAHGELMSRAALEIEFLRQHVGAVSRGPSLAEIARDLPKRMTVEGGS